MVRFTCLHGRHFEYNIGQHFGVQAAKSIFILFRFWPNLIFFGGKNRRQYNRDYGVDYYVTLIMLIEDTEISSPPVIRARDPAPVIIFGPRVRVWFRVSDSVEKLIFSYTRQI